MLFFQRKLQTFLVQAELAHVIDSQILTDLSNFSAQQNNSTNSLRKLNTILYTIGSFLSILGIILLISHNWNNISNLTKLIGYLGLLGGITLLALYTTNQTLAKTLFLTNSGLILAGIGLIAQIYNLSSATGSAFLIWGLLILPTTLLLNWQWLNLMAIYAFCQWLMVYLNYLDILKMPYWPILLGNVLIFLKLDRHNQYWFLIKIIQLIAVIYYYLLLLSNFRIIQGDSELNFIYLLLIILGAASTWYLIHKRQETPLQYLYIWLLSSLPFLLSYCNSFIYEISINLIWIVLPITLVGYGVKQTHNGLINLGSTLLFIYIVTKFFDYFGSMLTSGSAFLGAGISCTLLAVYFQKIRLHLITHSRHHESEN